MKKLIRYLLLRFYLRFVQEKEKKQAQKELKEAQNELESLKGSFDKIKKTLAALRYFLNFKFTKT